MTHSPQNLINKWFRSKGWKPFHFQKDVWESYNAGYNGLIHASTGMGKTYSIWFANIIEYLNEHPEFFKKNNKLNKEKLRILWITPLRALSYDTKQSLQAAIDELNLNWTVDIRSGDTSESDRKKQLRDLPTCLITTPESLSLILTYKNSDELLSGIRCVVVDEWHELLSSKRGTMTELVLARIRKFNPDVRTWGLSATLGNLEIAAQTLFGANNDNYKIIKGLEPKKIVIESLLPIEIERFPKAGHLGIKMLPQVVDEIGQSGSILVFTNTRSQAEIWFQEILDYDPYLAGDTAIHHSSIDKEKRIYVEDALKSGKLKNVICTSSLDLGVDFAPVDRVMQIGSIKGIARMLQRAGRSGHQPHKESRLIFVPTNSFELIEIAAARDAIAKNDIEPRIPQSKPYDVLAQHLVTIAIGLGFTYQEMYNEIISTYSYKDLNLDEWIWILNFIINGGETLKSYPDYSKVIIDDGIYKVIDRGIIRRHRMSIGTITSENQMKVKFISGAYIGTIEEYFVSRLKKGDNFIFAGKNLEYMQIKDMTVLVRISQKEPDGNIPSWLGGRMPLSTELSKSVRNKLEEIRNNQINSVEIETLLPLIDLQKKWSYIPASNEILIEKLFYNKGYHIFIFPFEGFMVHEGLAAILGYRLSRSIEISFTYAVNDYGLEFYSNKEIDINKEIENGLFSIENLMEDILAGINKSEMGKRQFREIARVAGLVFNGYPGASKSTKQLQASSSLFFDVFSKFDPDNLLLKQTFKEVLENQLEYQRIFNVFERINNSKLVIKEILYPTPFSFPIMANRMRAAMSSEKLSDRIKKIQDKLERAADE